MPALTFSKGAVLPDRMYVDSNVAIAFLYKTHTLHHAAATFVLESLVQSRRLLFSVLAMDELWHILMGTWHREALGSKFDPKNKRDVARWAGQVETTSKRLLAMSNVELCAAPSVTQLCDTALAALRKHHLGARDAFHVATASEVGISAIATADGDFDDLPGLTIVKIA